MFINTKDKRINSHHEVRGASLGYPFGKKGWKVYDLDSRELFVSRDVVFFKDILKDGRN